MILKHFQASMCFITASIFLSFSTFLYAAALTFKPAEDVFYYGDVYINQMANIPVFTISATGGDCFGTIRPDFGQPTPGGKQTIAPCDFDLSSGDESGDIWIGIQSDLPGDHCFYIKIESNCGTYYKTINFHCIGYGYINGSATDLLSGEPILTATVAPGNPYNMQITMAGNGDYSARGYPGYHWLFATAENYTEQSVNIELHEGDEITHDFRLKPNIPLSDVILALQLMTGMALSESPTYQVDINKDGKIGIAEIIAYLRIISE